MFATRLISGIILVVLALFLVGQGGVVLFLASLGIYVIGQYELYRVTKMEDKLLGAVVYDYLCHYLSQVRDGTGDSSFFWHLLCGGDVFLSLPGSGNGGRKVSGLADFFKFLGMRYLRLLCGNAAWEA